MKEKTGNFFKNINYQKLKNKLDYDDFFLLVVVIADAIQYGIDIMADDLQSEQEKK